LETNPDDAGFIEINGTTVFSYPNTRTVSTDSTVSLAAKPASGYKFDGWSGDLTSNENLLVTSFDSRVKIVANFSPIMHSLRIDTNGGGSCLPAAGVYDYQEGSLVMLTAEPDAGWQFDGWDGDVTNPNSIETTFTVDSDKNITAHFSPVIHTLELEVSGRGLVNPAAGTYTYIEGTELQITAIPDSGWKFASWSGDVTHPRQKTTKVIMGTDKAVAANFSQASHTAGITGIIAGATAAGLVAFFVTRRRQT
jgi:uncharacterized repeat protein (TIGR02543 family)